MYVHLTIHGKVRGVFFRASTKELADKLDIRGTIQNTGKRMLDIHAYGDEEKLRRLREWCQDGPEFAEVETIEEEWSEGEDGPGSDLARFEIAY